MTVYVRFPTGVRLFMRCCASLRSEAYLARDFGIRAVAREKLCREIAACNEAILLGLLRQLRLFHLCIHAIEHAIEVILRPWVVASRPFWRAVPFVPPLFPGIPRIIMLGPYEVCPRMG